MLIPGNGVVLIGMSERSSRQAITQVAAELFAQGAAEKVIVAGMPKLRAAMHLDGVHTFADRDVVTIYPEIVDSIASFTLVPGDNDIGVDVIDETKPFVEVVAAALSAPNCESWKPAARSTTTSASSGTAAITSSPSNPVWCSHTTATPTPTRCCVKPGRSDHDRRCESSAAAVGAVTA